MPMSILHSTFRASTLQKLDNLPQTDVVIGLVTHRTPISTAVAVAKASVAGAKSHFRPLKTVVLTADAGLRSNLRMPVQGPAVTNVPVVPGRHPGGLGRGTAASVLLHAAVVLKARAIGILNTNRA